jgi:hypothetical protein
MTEFLFFFSGQLAGIAVQAARWVNDDRGWAEYFRHRSHQGRHVIDLILSVVVFLAWGNGMLMGFAGLFGESAAAWVAKLPEAPLATGALVVGFVLCFVSRKVARKYIDVDPEPTPPLPPKGD